MAFLFPEPPPTRVRKRIGGFWFERLILALTLLCILSDQKWRNGKLKHPEKNKNNHQQMSCRVDSHLVSMHVICLKKTITRQLTHTHNPAIFFLLQTLSFFRTGAGCGGFGGFASQRGSGDFAEVKDAFGHQQALGAEVHRYVQRHRTKGEELRKKKFSCCQPSTPQHTPASFFAPFPA